MKFTLQINRHIHTHTHSQTHSSSFNSRRIVFLLFTFPFIIIMLCVFSWALFTFYFSCVSHLFIYFVLRVDVVVVGFSFILLMLDIAVSITTYYLVFYRNLKCIESALLILCVIRCCCCFFFIHFISFVYIWYVCMCMRMWILNTNTEHEHTTYWNTFI